VTLISEAPSPHSLTPPTLYHSQGTNLSSIATIFKIHPRILEFKRNIQTYISPIVSTFRILSNVAFYFYTTLSSCSFFIYLVFLTLINKTIAPEAPSPHSFTPITLYHSPITTLSDAATIFKIHPVVFEFKRNIQTYT
jgi:exopolysaccharide biosynthesis predicted pyruvyltransferase EpsI